MSPRPGLTLRQRGLVIYDLAAAYSNLADAGAPDDLLLGVAYWLRKATREGITDADLAHALDATSDGKVSPLQRKAPP